MKLEIQKTLVVSTMHISERDNTLLNDAFREAPENLIIKDEDYGWCILTASLGNLNASEFIKMGFSDDFVKCLMLGFINDCEWVCFDCDGPQYKFLNIHEW